MDKNRKMQQDHVLKCIKDIATVRKTLVDINKAGRNVTQNYRNQLRTWEDTLQTHFTNFVYDCEDAGLLILCYDAVVNRQYLKGPDYWTKTEFLNLLMKRCFGDNL